MGTITLNLPRPHEAQKAILANSARYKVLDCGRRFGKTELFVQCALLGHAPQTQGMLAGLPIAYVALTYKNVEEFWQRMKATIPPAMVAAKNEVYMTLKLITGGYIECWTFEKFAAARGRAYAGIILDEASITPNLKEAWQEVFQAMLLDYEGWAIFGSTPNGFNFFFELYGYGQNPDLEEWASFKYTSYDNPKMNPLEIDKLKKTLPDDTFRREYLAEFEAGGGGVFRLGEIAPYPYTTPQEKHLYVMGIDWGQADDNTVAVVFDATDYREVIIYRRNHANYEDMIRDITDLAHIWQVEKIIPESNSMGVIAIEMLANEINKRQWPIHPKTKYPSEPVIQQHFTSHKSKDNLVKLMIAGLESGLILIPNSLANHELTAYQTKQSASGLWTYDAPSGGHDDTVIARMLANYACYELRS